MVLCSKHPLTRLDPTEYKLDMAFALYNFHMWSPIAPLNSAAAGVLFLLNQLYSSS